MADLKKSRRKSTRKFERYFKGVANHRRVEILMLIFKNPDISLDGIVGKVNGNTKTVADHTRRLMLAGLVEKRHIGRSVAHNVTPYGEKFAKFIETFPK